MMITPSAPTLLGRSPRSEEHTSELQSRENLVCRLLLEKTNTHAQAFGELARSMEAEVSEQVVEVEGRSLRLTGTAEEQSRQWREMLREYQAEGARPDHG